MYLRHIQKLSVLQNYNKLYRATRVASQAHKLSCAVPNPEESNSSSCAPKCSHSKSQADPQSSGPCSSIRNASRTSSARLLLRPAAAKLSSATRNASRPTRSSRGSVRNARAFKIRSEKLFGRNETKKIDKASFTTCSVQRTLAKKSRGNKYTEEVKLKKILSEIWRTSRMKYNFDEGSHIGYGIFITDPNVADNYHNATISGASKTLLTVNEPLNIQQRCYSTKRTRIPLSPSVKKTVFAKKIKTCVIPPLKKFPDPVKDSEKPLVASKVCQEPPCIIEHQGLPYFYRRVETKGNDGVTDEIQKVYFKYPDKIIKVENVSKNTKASSNNAAPASQKVRKDISINKKPSKPPKFTFNYNKALHVEHIKEVRTKSVTKISEEEYLAAISSPQKVQQEEDYYRKLLSNKENSTQLGNQDAENENNVKIRYTKKISATSINKEIKLAEKTGELAAKKDENKYKEALSPKEEKKHEEIIVIKPPSKNSETKENVLTTPKNLQMKTEMPAETNSIEDKTEFYCNLIDCDLKYCEKISKELEKKYNLEHTSVNDELEEKIKATDKEINFYLKHNKSANNKLDIVPQQLETNQDLGTKQPRESPFYYKSSKRFFKLPSPSKLIENNNTPVYDSISAMEKLNLEKDTKDSFSDIKYLQFECKFPFDNVCDEINPQPDCPNPCPPSPSPSSKRKKKEKNDPCKKKSKCCSSTEITKSVACNMHNLGFPEAIKDTTYDNYKPEYYEFKPEIKTEMTNSLHFEEFYPWKSSNTPNEVTAKTEPHQLTEYEDIDKKYKANEENLKLFQRSASQKQFEDAFSRTFIEAKLVSSINKTNVAFHNVEKFAKDAMSNVPNSHLDPKKKESFVTKNLSRDTRSVKSDTILGISNVGDTLSFDNLETYKLPLKINATKDVKETKDLLHVKNSRAVKSSKILSVSNTEENLPSKNLETYKRPLKSITIKDAKKTVDLPHVENFSRAVKSNTILNISNIGETSPTSFSPKNNANKSEMNKATQCSEIKCVSKKDENMETEEKPLGVLIVTIKAPTVENPRVEPFILEPKANMNKILRFEEYKKQFLELESKKPVEFEPKKSMGTVLLNPHKKPQMKQEVNNELSRIEKICKEELLALQSRQILNQDTTLDNVNKISHEDRKKANFSKYVEKSQSNQNINKVLLEDNSKQNFDHSSAKKPEDLSAKNTDNPKKILSIIDKIWHQVEMEANRKVKEMEKSKTCAKQTNYRIIIEAETKQLNSITDLQSKAVKPLDENFNKHSTKDLLKTEKAEIKSKSEKKDCDVLSDPKIKTHVINQSRKESKQHSTANPCFSHEFISKQLRSTTNLEALKVQKSASFSSCGATNDKCPKYKPTEKDPFGRCKPDPYKGKHKKQCPTPKPLDLRINMKAPECDECSPPCVDTKNVCQPTPCIKDVCAMINYEAQPRPVRPNPCPPPCPTQKCKKKKPSCCKKPPSCCKKPSSSCPKSDPCKKKSCKKPSPCKSEPSCCKKPSSSCRKPDPCKKKSKKSCCKKPTYKSKPCKKKSKKSCCRKPSPCKSEPCKKKSKKSCRKPSPCKSEPCKKKFSSSCSKQQTSPISKSSSYDPCNVTCPPKITAVKKGIKHCNGNKLKYKIPSSPCKNKKKPGPCKCGAIKKLSESKLFHKNVMCKGPNTKNKIQEAPGVKNKSSWCQITSRTASLCKKSGSANSCKNTRSASTCGKSKDESPCKKPKPASPCGKSKAKSPCKASKPASPCKSSRPASTCKSSRPASTCKSSRPASTCGKSKAKSPCKASGPASPCKSSRPASTCKSSRPASTCKSSRPASTCGKSKAKSPCKASGPASPCKSSRPASTCKSSRPASTCKSSRPASTCKSSRPASTCGKSKAKSPCKASRPASLCKSSRPASTCKSSRPASTCKSSRPASTCGKSKAKSPCKETKPASPCKKSRPASTCKRTRPASRCGKSDSNKRPTFAAYKPGPKVKCSVCCARETKPWLAKKVPCEQENLAKDAEESKTCSKKPSCYCGKRSTGISNSTIPSDALSCSKIVINRHIDLDVECDPKTGERIKKKDDKNSKKPDTKACTPVKKKCKCKIESTNKSEKKAISSTNIKSFSTKSLPKFDCDYETRSDPKCEAEKCFGYKKCKSNFKTYTRTDVHRCEAHFKPPKICKLHNFQFKIDKCTEKKYIHSNYCTKCQNSTIREVSKEYIEKVEDMIEAKKCFAHLAMKTIPHIPPKVKPDKPKYLDILKSWQAKPSTSEDSVLYKKREDSATNSDCCNQGGKSSV